MIWWKQLLTLGIPLLTDAVRESRARKRAEKKEDFLQPPYCRNCVHHPSYRTGVYENQCWDCEDLSNYERR